MNSSVFEKVLLSAVLTSCTVFSVLMVTLTPRRPEPITIEPTDRIEAAEDINHRDAVIRHIGMSIVVSVGAGITTAEMLRKWGRSRDGIASRQQVFSAQAMLQAVTMPDLALPTDGFTASFSGLSGSDLSGSDLSGSGLSGSGLSGGIVSDEWDGAHKQAVAVLAPDRTNVSEQTVSEQAASDQPGLPLFLFQRPMPLPTETVNWFLPAPLDSTLSDASAAKGLMVADEQSTDWQPTNWQPTAPLLLTAREQYQTCRICLSDAPERLLAILFEGQYYRFVKVVTDRKQALSLAATLEQEGQPAVITSTHDRDAVWALAPDAYPDAAATDLVSTSQRF